jgi:hypothetical protein
LLGGEASQAEESQPPAAGGRLRIYAHETRGADTEHFGTLLHVVWLI